MANWCPACESALAANFLRCPGCRTRLSSSLAIRADPNQQIAGVCFTVAQRLGLAPDVVRIVFIAALWTQPALAMFVYWAIWKAAPLVVPMAQASLGRHWRRFTWIEDLFDWAYDLFGGAF